MKKFKNLYKKLMEDYTEGGSVFNGFADANPRRSAHVNYGNNHFGQGDSVSRLNAFIHKFLTGSYIDINAPIVELRSRLNHAGLDFPFDGNKIKLQPGINTFPLKLYGDVFGTTPTTDLMKNFDRGENIPGAILEIQCSYDSDSCMWTISGKIKPTGSQKEINESVELLNEIVPFIGAALGAVGRFAGSKLGQMAVQAGKNFVKQSAGDVMGKIDTLKSAMQKLSPSANQQASQEPEGSGVGQGEATPEEIAQKSMGEYGNKTKKKSKKMCEGGNCGGETDMPAPVIGGDGSNYNMGINFGGDQLVNTGDPLKPIPMYEEKQNKDKARALMHFITRKGEVRSRVLMPVFTHLAQKSQKSKLGTDAIKRELYYVVNSASRKASLTLSKEEKDRVVNDLVRNFRKYLRGKSSSKTTKSKKISKK